VATKQATSAIDPVCGRRVAARGALFHAEAAGRRFVFCSEECRRRFAADRGRWSGRRDDVPLPVLIEAEKDRDWWFG
jgi:YHS domain-containing protein